MNDRKKIAQLIIARLDGTDIKKKFTYYESLVKKGISGFIVFGVKLKDVTHGIKKLQDRAEIPLFIASDLEQGLGQHITGGTLFPPAMALAQAINPKNKNDIKLLRRTIHIIAQEARAAGINTICSPVLDVNTNPQNPIICTRAFSESPHKVAWFGNEFIKGFQQHGLFACAKHFPGHGDTTKDSHRELPVVYADMKRLRRVELYPFKHAIKSEVKMIMVGHLKIPALDAHYASSLSRKTICGLLRQEMNFKGLVITDAMNMHAVSRKSLTSEARACLMALDAGADILLHPEHPEKVIQYLSSRGNEIMPAVERSFHTVLNAKKNLKKVTSPLKDTRVGIRSHWKTAHELTRKSIKVSPGLKTLHREPIILILDDDNCNAGDVFAKTIKTRYPGTKTIYIDNQFHGSTNTLLKPLSDKTLIAAVFSKISAWKGRAGLSKKLKTILQKAVKTSGYSVIAGFCCPYVFSGIKADAVIEAYSDSELSQEAAGKILCGP
ncbi:MAG: hypothetical protein KAJ59_03865 [Thermodesulfovibrionia bacterium]|nr:hypothetical protein [Thermodesulfovibrionia bacterium]